MYLVRDLVSPRTWLAFIHHFIGVLVGAVVVWIVVPGLVADALGLPAARGADSGRKLAQALPVGCPAVSKHLRVLSDAGLISHTTAGTRNFYALAEGGMAPVQQWLAQTWDTVLAAYAAEVTRTACTACKEAGHLVAAGPLTTTPATA